MNRELPDQVIRMLQTPKAPETLSLVRRCNISARHWDIFCRAMSGGLKRCKQKDIAAELRLSASRISKIVRHVRERLILAVEKPNDPDKVKVLVRAYRKSRFKVLKTQYVANAKPASEITILFTSDRYATFREYTHLSWGCKVDFVVGGEYLSIKGRSRLDAPQRGFEWEPTKYDMPYTIFWAEKGNGPAEVIAERLFGSNCYTEFAPPYTMALVRCSLLLVDFNERFWVVDSYQISEDEKRLSIYLKPAELVEKK